MVIQKEYKLFSFVFIILIALSCSSSEKNEQMDPFLNIKIPVYPNAYDTVAYLNKPSGTKSVYYKIKINFPAKDVISFYEEQFEKMGFIGYSEDGYGIREWENFNPKTGNWEITSVIPARYIATWVDKEKKLRIVLFIRYKYDGMDKNWRNILLVNCSVSNFFDFTKLSD